MSYLKEIPGRAKSEKDHTRHQSTQKERTQSVLNIHSSPSNRCRTAGTVSGTVSSLDPRSAETTLLEILGLVRRCEEYNDLMTNKMNDISHPHPPAPSKLDSMSAVFSESECQAIRTA